MHGPVISRRHVPACCRHYFTPRLPIVAASVSRGAGEYLRSPVPALRIWMCFLIGILIAIRIRLSVMDN